MTTEIVTDCAKHQVPDGAECRDCPLGYIGVGNECMLDADLVVIAIAILATAILFIAFGALYIWSNALKNKVYPLLRESDS